VNEPLGDIVVSDFDGTLAKLIVPWQSLRETLAVERIEDLWKDPDPRRWAAVTRAEVDAAHTASPVPAVMQALESVRTIAVLTSNDETAVETFLGGWPDLRARVRAVIGRRALGGPKTDFTIFSKGYARCVRAASAGAEGADITYLGDMRYELDYARRLGARALDVTELESAPRGPGRR
jgi:phosphoglycolate phosphatase-like HAD superfamily hydrolase